MTLCTHDLTAVVLGPVHLASYPPHRTGREGEVRETRRGREENFQPDWYNCGGWIDASV